MLKNRTHLPLAIIAAVAIVVVAFRSLLIPINHDEAATFFYYVQTGKFLPFLSHVDVNNHFLNSALSYFCFKLFGNSPFSLRIPNLLALLALIYGTYRLSLALKSNASKTVLATGLLLSIHWLSFFSVTRGYGLAMALLLLALVYLTEYLQKPENHKFLCFLVFMHLSISAILVLVIPAMLITAFIVVFQVHKKLIRKGNVIALHLLNLLLLSFWAKYSFFFKKAGALYHGEGDNYYEVTFRSLIELILGYNNNTVTIVATTVGIVALVLPLLIFRKRLKNIFVFFYEPSLLFLSLFISLVICFFLMKKLMGVNYPEDRTGLFFYLLLILILAFSLDALKARFANFTAWGFLFLFALHFTTHLNFTNYTLSTMPYRFYERLLKEQEKQPERITIGGHFMYELFFAFMNYRNDAPLNLPDPEDEMYFNTDYYIAEKSYRHIYKDYYEEIDVDEATGFSLLKRKYEAERRLLFSSQEKFRLKGKTEFFEFFKLEDTIFTEETVLLGEFNFSVFEAKVPHLAWLVMSIDSDISPYYKRLPMDFLKYDWNNSQGNTYNLVTGPLKGMANRMVCYFWNPKLEFIDIEVNGMKIYELKGKGINLSRSIHDKP